MPFSKNLLIFGVCMISVSYPTYLMGNLNLKFPLIYYWKNRVTRCIAYFLLIGQLGLTLPFGEPFSFKACWTWSTFLSSINLEKHMVRLHAPSSFGTISKLFSTLLCLSTLLCHHRGDLPSRIEDSVNPGDPSHWRFPGDPSHWP